MDANTNICQSCAMPLNPDVLGTNKDGSKNADYCVYCMKDGEFTSDQTMEECIETCVPFCSNGNPWLDADTARTEMRKFFPNLKRWREASAK
jgi:hypothetical protein